MRRSVASMQHRDGVVRTRRPSTATKRMLWPDGARGAGSHQRGTRAMRREVAKARSAAGGARVAETVAIRRAAAGTRRLATSVLHVRRMSSYDLHDHTRKLEHRRAHEAFIDKKETTAGSPAARRSGVHLSRSGARRRPGGCTDIACTGGHTLDGSLFTSPHHRAAKRSKPFGSRGRG